MDHHGYEFSKKTEGNGCRFGVARTSNFERKHLESEKDGIFYDVLTSSLFVHESKSKMCELTKTPRKKKGVHSYSRSGQHVLEVTSCYRSLQKKI